MRERSPLTLPFVFTVKTQKFHGSVVVVAVDPVGRVQVTASALLADVAAAYPTSPNWNVRANARRRGAVPDRSPPPKSWLFDPNFP